MVGPSRRPDDGRQVSTVDRLALKQQADDQVESVTMPAQQLGRRILGLPQEPGHFLVDGTLRFLGIGSAGERVTTESPCSRPRAGGQRATPS